MSHFAKVENGIVTQVVVADQDVIDSGAFGSGWIQTSYNTRGGVHYEPNSSTPSQNQSKALRKNYAGIGYTYDLERDAFIPPPLFNSWILNEDTCLWEPPIPYPNDENMYQWNEETQSWDQIIQE
jgi:hypothetical protein